MSTLKKFKKVSSEEDILRQYAVSPNSKQPVLPPAVSPDKPDYDQAVSPVDVQPVEKPAVPPGQADYDKAKAPVDRQPVEKPAVPPGQADYDKAKAPMDVQPVEMPAVTPGKADYDATVGPKDVVLGTDDDKQGQTELEVHTRDKSMLRVMTLAAMLKDNYTFSYDDMGLYVYDEETGRHLELRRPQPNVSHDFESFAINNIPQQYAFWLTDSIMAKLYRVMRKNHNFSNQLPIAPPCFSNLTNGVYDMRTGDLQPHSPAFGFKYAIRAKFLENPVLSDVSTGFLKNLGNGEQGMMQLLAGNGIGISTYRGLQVMQLLVGTGQSGKGVWSEFYRAQYPQGLGLVESMTLDELGDRFVSGKFKTANLVIATEIKSGIWGDKSLMRTKQFVSSDYLEMELKNVDAIDGKPQAFLLATGNKIPQIPRTKDPGGGMLRRIWFLRTGPMVKEPVDNMIDYLVEDIDAITSKALLTATQFIANPKLMTRIKPEELYCDQFNVADLDVDDCLRGYLRDKIIYTGIATDMVPLEQILEDIQCLYQDVTLIQIMVKSGLSKRLRKILGPGTVIEKYSGSGRFLFNYKMKNQEVKK